jgi:hypothetical protein
MMQAKYKNYFFMVCYFMQYLFFRNFCILLIKNENMVLFGET